MTKKVYIVSHTHFDAEVFLTREETFEMAFPNLLGALAMMRTDPDFKFVLDQTCYIEPFLRRYPEQRAFMQAMIDAGRLQITCGMLAMPDVNLPSGESFIRQVLQGQRYCERELGVKVTYGWLIDTFGQHPQLPQLMSKCGFENHTFQRVMPKDSPSEFYWEGLDGSRVLCHWMPIGYAAFYGPPANEHEFAKYARRHLGRLASHAVTDHILALSGADLTPVEPQLKPMIERFNASQDDYELAMATPRDFYEAFSEVISDRQQALSIVTGDLNPVFQGCYSARIDIKQFNRMLEHKLLDGEKYHALAGWLGAVDEADFKALQGRLDEAWQGVLFNQFHDIICGCLVDTAYASVIDRYKYSDGLATRALNESLDAVARKIDTTGEVGVPVVVFNSLGWARTDAVECEVAFTESDVFEVEVLDGQGRLIPSDLLTVERYDNGGIRRATLVFIAGDVPSFGHDVYRVLPASGEAVTTDLDTSRPEFDLREDREQGFIENEFYRIEFDMWSGVMTRLFDKANQWEVLREDKPIGNTVVKEEDFGNFWQYHGPCKGDAFQALHGIYPFPEENDTKADFSHRYAGDGQIRHGHAMVEFSIEFPFGSGFYATRVRLYAGVRRIDIRTTLINNDERVRYRVAFPTSLAGGTITNEIPFGAIDRPEGEFPAQNWIDYHGEGKGLALLNRGLPGNNVVDGVMMVSLMKCTAIKEGYGESGGFNLRTPTGTGYELGKRHEFDYSLLPHAGDWRQAGVYRHGMEYNEPLRTVKTVAHGGVVASRVSFVAVSEPDVLLSAVKADGRDLIVRVYEAAGCAASGVQLTLARPIAEAHETDLVEKGEGVVGVSEDGHSIAFDIGAFEIKTFRLCLR